MSQVAERAHVGAYIEAEQRRRSSSSPVVTTGRSRA